MTSEERRAAKLSNRAKRVKLHGLRTGLKQLWAGYARAIRSVSSDFSAGMPDDAKLSMDLADGFKIRIDALTKELDELL